jgi:hypothetical protein
VSFALRNRARCSLSDSKSLTVMTRDVATVCLDIGRLLPQQIQHLVSNTSSSRSSILHVGTARPDATVSWTPRRSGAFLVRAVDDQGRADSRELRVAVVP